MGQLRFMSVTAVLLAGVAGAGCVSSSRFEALQKELEQVRYQYQLERLYVSGLTVQNRQLRARRDGLRSEMQEREAAAARAFQPAPLPPSR